MLTKCFENTSETNVTLTISYPQSCTHGWQWDAATHADPAGRTHANSPLWRSTFARDVQWDPVVSARHACLGTTARNTSFVSLHMPPPSTHFPSTTRPLLYLRFPNFWFIDYRHTFSPDQCRCLARHYFQAHFATVAEPISYCLVT